MNNKIIDVKNIPDSHKEINGRDNFGIVHVLDGEGNTVPEGKIEKTHMWCRDGKSELEMKTH